MSSSAMTNWKKPSMKEDPSTIGIWDSDSDTGLCFISTTGRERP